MQFITLSLIMLALGQGRAAHPPGLDQGVDAGLEALPLRPQLLDGRMGRRVFYKIREEHQLADLRRLRPVLQQRQQLAVDAFHSGRVNQKPINKSNISLV